MPSNWLLTGRPRVGKSTALERTIEILEASGFTPGGVMAPAIYRDGERVGFQLVDVLSGATVDMAHVDFASGPSVGKYHVDVDAVDRLSAAAFDQAHGRADLFVVDEIAPMEISSDVFVEAVANALDSNTPLVGVVHRSDDGFIKSVKARPDTEVITVTTANRESVPARLVDRVESASPDI